METIPTMPMPTEPECTPHSFFAHIAGATMLLLVFVLSGLSAYAYFDTSSPANPHASALPQVAAATVGDSGAPPPVTDVFSSVTLSAKSAIVIDATTHMQLYAQNPDVQLPLASLTKVPLALAALQVLPPESIIRVMQEVPPTSNTGALPAGSAWRVKDIVDFTLAGSSNGGAELLALAADEPIRARFPQAPAGGAAVWLMNDIARAHGGPNMYFLNATGLDESTTQSGAYGTARAIAALFAYAASAFPEHFSATTRAQVSVTSESGHAVVATNTDEVLGEIPGLVMGKTGFTELAGGNLGVVFEVSGHRFVAVVLGSSKDGRFTDMRTLVHAVQSAMHAL